ncbi:hypothetical protein [Phenylobacterium sp.]|jgi:hypothetical protein|uniref:hypothetical protein n=1 Tax=Phenylobacterium sp. TaxID=1871053 RepID=UPI002E3398B7|nr:hypothetical protein [Phenylobacterium sp.]HEX2559477.1 hypothetical protein [Phenylobacterium sp.]
MIRKLSYTLPALALLALAGLPATAAAEHDPIADTLASAEVAAAEVGGDAGTVTLTDLAEMNGEGADVDVDVDIDIDNSTTVENGALSMSELNATNSDNIINGGVIAGDVNVSGDALRGFNGVGNFVINTGAQSNLQGSINITINSGN